MDDNDKTEEEIRESVREGLRTMLHKNLSLWVSLVFLAIGITLVIASVTGHLK